MLDGNYGLRITMATCVCVYVLSDINVAFILNLAVVLFCFLIFFVIINLCPEYYMSNIKPVTRSTVRNNRVYIEGIYGQGGNPYDKSCHQRKGDFGDSSD
jgi:hypothetical protein